MPDIPAGWLAIITGIGGAIGAAIAYAVRYVLAGKDTEIKELKAECAAYRARIDSMQNESLIALKETVAVERKRAETDQRTAAALETQNSILARFVPSGATS